MNVVLQIFNVRHCNYDNVICYAHIPLVSGGEMQERNEAERRATT